MWTTIIVVRKGDANAFSRQNLWFCASRFVHCHSGVCGFASHGLCIVTQKRMVLHPNDLCIVIRVSMVFASYKSYIVFRGYVVLNLIILALSSKHAWFISKPMFLPFKTYAFTLQNLCFCTSKPMLLRGKTYAFTHNFMWRNDKKQHAATLKSLFR